MKQSATYIAAHYPTQLVYQPSQASFRIKVCVARFAVAVPAACKDACSKGDCACVVPCSRGRACSDEHALVAGAGVGNGGRHGEVQCQSCLFPGASVYHKNSRGSAMLRNPKWSIASYYCFCGGFLAEQQPLRDAPADDLTPQSAHLLLASLRNLRTSLTHTLDRLDATILRVHARAALSTLPQQAALGTPGRAPATAPHAAGNGPGEQPVETRLQADPWVLRAQTVENRIMRLRQTARELRERAEASDGRALPAVLGQEPADRIPESANNDNVSGGQAMLTFIDSIRQDQAQIENGMRRLTLSALTWFLRGPT